MPHPIISVAQMREWEKATWASGQTAEVVIRAAGAAVARLAEERTKPGDLILVLVGKGHNGDDARWACKQLQNRKVDLQAIATPESALPGLLESLQQKPALIIDGLFGIGLNRSLSVPWLELIGRVNRSGVPILSVDVPSGLDANLGVPLDDAIRATWTLTFGAVKEGLIQATAWPFVGKLRVASDIGLMPYPFSTECSLVDARDFAGATARRPVDGHKGMFGHLAIMAGSLGYHGAAVLAARGAQRAQPGLITLYTSGSVYVPVASQLQSVMVRPWSDEARMPENCTGILAGPGLASTEIPERIKQAVRLLWQESPLPMVLDASALDWVPAGWCNKDAVRVMTPHPGEAARLLKTSVYEIQHNRAKAVRELSRCWGGCRVVLKGHQTMTGQQKEELFINNTGNPQLAQGGSGDLLAGYLAGMLAQPDLQSDVAQTIRYAVWQHGAAADALSAMKPNWILEELASQLGNIKTMEEEADKAGQGISFL